MNKEAVVQYKTHLSPRASSEKSCGAVQLLVQPG